ncbi:MAG: hypothetical protein A2W18_15045 [Candidatus Muproteobacteria bacterium RBG_16_60_9]|uniref:Tetratricopeptide repeat-like domain-containing protein n=1 Tax=Candidatus Muproteobacteria bacterium RBG_16_60_9 TaxID=1817755 RepID=A0A1F6UW67_9PROT|nr:MAG: hypothetical protein A2W18_15045 [Candidatus Muproteobacteria bacterium RBG_16_60_9]
MAGPRLILFAALAIVTVASVRADERRVVKNPHFGQVLFEFYQDNYFSALTRVMTEQQFTRLAPHAEEAELLRGGILLSYGAHQEAGRIFERLIAAGAGPATRDRAWFYLAKIRYQRGYIEQAEDAIARVEGALPGELEEERRLLHANLLMQRQQYQKAVDVLQRLPPRSDWAAYGRFNLGVALVRVGERESGVKLLEELGRARAPNEELAALKDKANVALAYAFLQDNQPARAKAYLQRVRLNGLLSNKALLGLGWADAALDSHERALVPWVELAHRNAVDAAVQESLLAVPYAYGKLGAYKQSLDSYEAALVTYAQESNRLDQAITAIREGKLVSNILRANPADEAGWFWRMQNPPDVPEARYLTQLLASHDFQEALKNYRDLRFLEGNLAHWSQQMQVYRDMVANRRQAYAERLPRVLSQERTLGLERLRTAAESRAGEIARIERESDSAALANDKERALLDRLERVQRALAGAPDADAAEKFRRYRGLLSWDLSVQYSERLWEAKKELRDVEGLLAQADQRRAALKQAQTEAPRGFEVFAQRIEALRANIERMRPAVAQAAHAQEQYLGELAADELSQQRERIAAYVTQARFAVAQIYDKAVRSEEARKE